MKVCFSNVNFRANKVSQAQAEYFKKTLKNSKNVNILCHSATDPDSACCAVTIASYLAQAGIKAKIIASEDLSSLGVKNSEKYEIINEKDLQKDEKVEGTTLCVDFSSKERMSKNTLNYIDKADKLLCIDHHRGIDISDHDYIYINHPLENNYVRGVASCYADSSAKSATSVIYRFLEALDEDINEEQAYNLFLGLADDGSKRGYIRCNAKDGTIKIRKDAKDDKNFIEVYEKLKNKLSNNDIVKIAKEVDRTSNLSEEETKFKNYLYDNINYDCNNQLAYVVIPPECEEWINAGGDTPIVSTILNEFRQDILLNKDHKKEFKDLQIAMVFYKRNDDYRVSLHSRDVNLHNIYNDVLENCPSDNISIGGHTYRGGGKIAASDKDSQKLWVNQLIDACKNELSSNKN